MEYYKNEVARAWIDFLSKLRTGDNLVTAIGKIRGSYGEAIANSVQGQAIEILAKDKTDE